MSDARTGRRFPLNLPITIREGESADQTSGTTQNVSAAGVYIRADAELEVGSQIEFEISYRRQSRCTGKVSGPRDSARERQELKRRRGLCDR
ncbi:MAG: hypothetical protein DMG61_02060 [Acidobacteria bacterium]|nr:MAG: hypothetical protein DMG61_02060 [Acidobacteriota bacterium]